MVSAFGIPKKILSSNNKIFTTTTLFKGIEFFRLFYGNLFLGKTKHMHYYYLKLTILMFIVGFKGIIFCISCNAKYRNKMNLLFIGSYKTLLDVFIKHTFYVISFIEINGLNFQISLKLLKYISYFRRKSKKTIA